MRSSAARLPKCRASTPIGLPSAGLHTNGYSLARRVFFDVAGWRVDSMVSELGTTVGEALLAPHVSYLPPLRPLLAQSVVKGMAHITGGGITENLPRILPEGCAAEIETLIVACASSDARDVADVLNRGDARARPIGTIVRGDRTVRYL